MSDATIILCCYNRARQLDRTLESIAAQDYTDVDTIVVEDGNDGRTEEIARKWGAIYIHHERADEWPTFQSISLIRNIGIRAAQTPVIILQDAEMMYENKDAVSNLIGSLWVQRLGNSPDKMVAAGMVKSLDRWGAFERWFTHPTYCPNSAGGSPRAMMRQTVLEMGGFEERFFGYGFEDNYFTWLMLKKTSLVYIPSVVAAHQWHEPTGGAYEPITGSSNEALVHRLTSEISWHAMPPVANLPIPTYESVSYDEVRKLVQAAVPLFANGDWQSWAQAYLQDDHGDINASSVARYKAASAAPHDREEHVAMRAAQAAWALEWIDRCDAECALHPERAARIRLCGENFTADAYLSVEIGNRVLNGEEVRLW
jgi:glycosyltransferase involved in cell wall biosynthesis